MNRNPLPYRPHSNRRDRSGIWLLVAACLAMSLALPGEARAQNAVLLLPDVCDDPAATFDQRWAQAKYGADSVFLMQADGAVRYVSGPVQAFGDARHVYVAAHGGVRTVGRIGYGDFADAFRAAHPAPPWSITFAVCGAGKGPGSLLKAVNDRYGGDVFRLAGGVTGCALAGDGSRDLALADYRINVVPSDRQLYDAIVANIETQWLQPYPGQARSYGEVCKALVVGRPFDGQAMAAFLGVVYREFSRPAVPKSASADYLELVSLNRGGDPLALCGSNPEGTGPVPCP